MHTALGAYTKHEHNWLGAFFQIIYGPGAYGPRPEVEAKISKEYAYILFLKMLMIVSSTGSSFPLNFPLKVNEFLP